MQKTLYKLSKTGKVLVWTIKTDGPQFWSEHGQLDGKIQIDAPVTAKGRSIGRSNEKTPTEQAEFEVARRIKGRMENQGYVENINNIYDDNSPDFFVPILAHGKLELRHFTNCEYVYASAKLDGIRGVQEFSVGAPKTRNGKPAPSANLIYDSLREIWKRYPDLVFDGELYNHELKHNFDRISSLARKTQVKSISLEDWNDIESMLQFHIFDVKDKSRPDLTFEERYMILQELNGLFFKYNKYIEVVKQVKLPKCEIAIKAHHDEQTALGYEGGMIRCPNGIYEHARSKILQKVKIFINEEFEVVDFLEGVHKGYAAKVVVKVPSGTSTAGINFPRAKCTEFFQNKDEWIGKLATIKFQNYTPGGKLRFAKMIDIDRPDL